MPKQKNAKIGSSVDDFLAAQGILEECEEQALKRILADQIKAAMEKDHLSKTAMAARMQPVGVRSTACSIRRTPA